MNQILADSDVNRLYASFYPMMEASYGAGGRVIVDAYADADMLRYAGCVVYFMSRDLDGLIKIGYTATLKNRRRMLEKQCGTPVHVLATVEGGLGLERLYQMRFDEHRLHGEWFARHPDILAEIDRINSLLPPPPLNPMEDRA